MASIYELPIQNELPKPDQVFVPIIQSMEYPKPMYRIAMNDLVRIICEEAEKYKEIKLEYNQEHVVFLFKYKEK